jgi:S-(hydroxymethyl)glutathione dehydrogenase/alcohol dehydrogenase
MSAAVLYKLVSPLVIETLTLPEQLDVGQVLVKVHTSSICGAQINEITGAKGEDKYLPHLMGHEGCGVVEGVGPSVTHVKKGDTVVLHWRKGKGIDAAPPKYKTIDGEVVGGGWVTTFNEYAVVSENRLTVIDKNTPHDIAALMGCCVTTGLGLINNEAQLKFGQSVAVAGCGGVGLNVIAGANLSGAYPIIGIDKNDKKLDLAECFGMSYGLKTSNFTDIKGLENVDVFVDCTGNPDIIEAGYSIAKKTILVGQPKYDQSLVFTNMRNNYTGKILMDSQGGLTNPNEDIPRYLKLYAAGKLKLDRLITKRIKLQEVNDVIVEMREGKLLGKCIIEM